MTNSGLSPDSMVAEDENQLVAEWFVNYLTSIDVETGTKVADIQTIVGGLTQWCVDHFIADERKALAGRLSDPALKFASEDGRDAASAVVEALKP